MSAWARPVVVVLLLCFRSAYAETILVPQDYPSIGAALQVASYGDTVLVAAGNYEEHDLLLPSGVTLISEEGPDVTIIDAQGLGRVIAVAEGADNTTRIEGFTITGGESTRSQAGGGIYWSAASPMIVNNVVEANSGGSGGGIFCGPGSATVRSNVISGNSGASGGGLFCGGPGCSAEIVCNDIVGNSAEYDGGGISCAYSSALIDSNYIAYNDAVDMGGGISCDDAVMTNNVIVSNIALAHGSSGGGIYCGWGGTAVIDHNVIAHNSATGGGGIKCEEADPVITSNTMYGNSGTYGSAIGIYGWAPVLERNILHSPGGWCVYAPASDVTVTCCDIYGNGSPWWPEEDNPVGANGNFSEDPLFCDPENDDFTLDACSPCLPGNHPQGWDCGLIGALGEGCSTASVVEHTESWSTIKALFR